MELKGKQTFSCCQVQTCVWADTHSLPKWLWRLMQASWADNPLSYYSKASRGERFLYVLRCVSAESRLHVSSRTRPRVCMPTLQCKSRLATGCFLFMWCWALVYKGTLRFGALCLSSCLVWCCSLVLGWPSWEGELHSCPPSPPHALLQGLEPCGTDAWSSRPHKEAPHMEARRSLVPAFIILLSEAPFFIPAALDFLFHLRLWKVCLFQSVSSPQCSRFLCASPSDSDAEVTVFKDGLGSEFKDLRLPSYLLLPDGPFIP